jgi:hypothetical protein
MAGIVAGANTLVAPMPGGGWRIEKIGGVDGAYDAAAASAVAITGDFALRAVDLGESNSFLFGLSEAPGGNDGFAEMRFALWLYQGEAYVFENGVHIPPRLPNGGTAWITRIGDVVRYHAGARPDEAAPMRSVTGAGGALWFDATIGKLGGAFGARFEAPGAWSHGRATAQGALAIGIGG